MDTKLYLIGISLGALSIPLAQAQAQVGVESEVGAGDIVVTAQKRAERLQDVPISVSVADAGQLESAGVKDLPQLQSIIPGLNVSVANGSFQLSMRGVATASNIVENPVSLYIDGVYLPQQQEGLRDLADTKQITVLKGPQGTLFGRNATAGVLQIETLGPSFDTSGQFNLSYGSYDTIRANSFLTAGLSNKIAVSLSAAYHTQGKGWGKSLSTGREENKVDHSYSLRGKMLVELGERSSLVIAGDYLNRLDSGATFQPYKGTTLAYSGFGPLDNRYDSYNGTAGHTAFEGGGVAATVKSDLGFADLVSISAYRKTSFAFKYDLSSVLLPLLISDAEGRSRMYSQELQLISNGAGPLKWVLGAYYFNYRQGYDYFNRDFGTGTAPDGLTPYRFNAALSRNATLNTFEKSESIAPFAQADLELTTRTTLTGGLRYTHEKRSLAGATQRTTVAGVVGPVTPVSMPSLTAKVLTWRAAINQKLADDVMVFASYSRGFKSGGYNIANPTAAGYLPEKLDDWEVGLKSQLWDRRITFNATGFYYRYKNVQVTQFGGNPPAQTVTNGAAAEIYGVDIDLTVKPMAGLTFSGGLELLHPYFTKFPGAQLGIDRTAGGVLIPAGGFDASDTRLPYARDYMATGAVDYAVPAFGGTLGFNVTATRGGSYTFEPDSVVSQPAYTMLNASVKWASEGDRVSLRFGVTNALDAAIISRNATIGANAPAGSTAVSANSGNHGLGRLVSYGTAPREYTLTLGAKF